MSGVSLSMMRLVAASARGAAWGNLGSFGKENRPMKHPASLIVLGAAFVIFLVMQFCFGMGEAGAFPNIARALYNWFPLRERGRASGVVWMSARVMGGLTPLIMAWLLSLRALSVRFSF